MNRLDQSVNIRLVCESGNGMWKLELNDWIRV